MWVKVTNPEENHNGFQYANGLNVLKEKFQKKGSCVPGGFYFTNLENLPNFYPYGVWIRVITIPDDAQVVKDPCTRKGEKWRSDKIILGDKYPLYDLKTIKKFNLQMNDYYVKQVFALNNFEILEWLKNSEYKIKCYEEELDKASYNSNIELLEFWKNSELPLECPETGLDTASFNGNIAVLNWYKNSGLLLRYSEKALDHSRYGGNIAVLDWWKNSGLLLKYSEKALDEASISGGGVAILEWWKNSGLELKYSEKALYYASLNNNIAVLEWWKNSGLPLKYSENLGCTFVGPAALKWLKNSGLQLTH